MADPIWLTRRLLPLLRARNFGPQRNQGLIVAFLDNPAGGDLIYKILFEKAYLVSKIKGNKLQKNVAFICF